MAQLQGEWTLQILVIGVFWFVGHKKNKATDNRKKGQLAAAKTPTEKMEHYELLSSFAQTNERININQLLWGDANESEEIYRKTFCR